MTSKATTVDEWMRDLPPDRREAVERLRALCRGELPGYEECIEYGMPGYRRNGVLEVSFNSQKQHIAIYILKKDVLDEFRAGLNASSIGKGCIRYSSPKKIDFDAIGRLLRRNAESADAPC